MHTTLKIHSTQAASPEMSLLKHDVLSELCLALRALHKKACQFLETELSENGTSLAQGGISQTLVRYTSPQVILLLRHGNGNQLHGSHFPRN